MILDIFSHKINQEYFRSRTNPTTFDVEQSPGLYVAWDITILKFTPCAISEKLDNKKVPASIGGICTLSRDAPPEYWY